ncbi:ABC transporter [Parasponia andersonii]|uniref:ABC transporter n=1 Tax=Parasponia andersonii TaxID=3476 RepID=A0A2P5CEJ4_PARAD|nr:ABC transporter [Parasponia andersonii]
MALGESITSQGKNTESVNGSISSIFMHADKVDLCLMSLGFLGAVFDGLTDRLAMLFTGHMINTIGSVSKLDNEAFQYNMNKNTVAMLYLAGISWVACFIEGYCWTRTGERQATRLRTIYLKAVLRQDLGYFDLSTTTMSEVITSISNDSFIIQDAISEKVPNFVTKVSTFIAGYMVAFVLLWQLALVALPLALFLIVPGWLCGRSLLELSREIRSEYNKAGTIAEQAISSIRTVYAFVGEKKTLVEFSSALNVSTKLGLKQGLVKGLAIGSGATIFAIWSLLSYYGSRLVMYNGFQGGTVFAATNSIIVGGRALGIGLSYIKDIVDAGSASERVAKMIKRIPKIDSEDTRGLILDNVSGKIEFKRVKFSYPSRPQSIVFKNFSLTIMAGKTVALVGTSGSGKSTTLSLLQRFYDPLEGEILLDGIATDKLHLKWLRSQMALVSQEPSLFSTTIKENILFGKDDATMEDVLKASEASDSLTFISQLPQGYDTQVGERGLQLSGGQKQRIALARAIIRKPRILLLDEATSALDSESERAVQKAIDNVATGRTTIIVAHRLSTIKNSDVIVVLENGRVKEIGSHNELLLRENSLYTSLVQLQRTEKNKNKEEHNCSVYSSSSPNKYFDNPIKNDDLPIRNDNLQAISRTDHSKFGNTSTPAVFEDDSKDPRIPTPSFSKLLALNKPERKQACLGCLSAILSGAVQPLHSVAMGTTISIYFSTDHDEIKERIRSLALWFFGLSLFSLLINICQHYSFGYIGENLTKRIREKMLSKILTFEVGWFDKDKNFSSVICSGLAKDASVVRSLVGDRISLLVQTISAVTISWTMGLAITWRLAIVLIVVQPLIVGCFYIRRVTLKSMSSKAIKEQHDSTKLAAEAVSNLRTITAFSSQDRILKWLEKSQEAPQKESIRQSWFAGIALGCSLSIKNCVWCLSYWYGGKLVSQGAISPKQVFQCINILVNTGRVIAEAGSMTTNLNKGWDSIRLVFAILDKNTKIEPENAEAYKPEKISGYVEFCDVHFAYPSRPNVLIFKGFSINIEAGKSMAFVGKSGSGKSTIIGLIERFYDPLKGVVKIDGRDIKSYHLRSLRKYIALVNQEPTLFAGTIRDNIIYGLSDNITETEIIEAARAANIHDFIISQKDGYETWCGNRGLQLSIIRNPSMLLLDEATSALDSQSEKEVRIALERVMTGRTSIVVAHRLCTINNCDEIAVIDKGEMVEKGTHSTLMAKGPIGAYHSLVSHQYGDNSRIPTLHEA